MNWTKVTRHQDEKCEAEAERVEDEKARTPPRRRAQSHHRDEQREETTTCISFFSFLQNQEIPLTKGKQNIFLRIRYHYERLREPALVCNLS